MKLLFHAFQLFCLTLFPSAKPELFLANVEQRREQARSAGDIEQSGSLGRDYNMHFEEKEMSNPEKSDDDIFHPSKQTINNYLFIEMDSGLGKEEMAGCLF